MNATPTEEKHPHNKLNSDQQTLAGVEFFSRRPNSGEATVVGGGKHKTGKTLQNATRFLLLRGTVVLSSKTWRCIIMLGSGIWINCHLMFIKRRFYQQIYYLVWCAQRGIMQKHLFGISVK